MRNKLAFIIVCFLSAGCVNVDKEVDKKAWLEEYGDQLMNYNYSKTQIEAEIEERWASLGYAAKPDKYIALSYDDGPCAGTAAMLKVLDDFGVKATFFVIGQNVRGQKAAAKSIYDAGHELANHSDDHGYLGNNGKLSVEKTAANLDAVSQAIKDITGNFPVLFRAPFLDHGANLTQVCTMRGMSLIDGVGYEDWESKFDAAAIAAKVLANPVDGGIMILHESNTSGGRTLAAMPEIIKGLREKGFWIMTVGQLAAVKGVTLTAGTRYNLIR
ncbi:MAG: polysaccharide deacetylase family protein [Treponema sp.]|jgi:peptidoglycan/xylan/chitin deacetylase (PgdA/CDA1 family)|nr:polysaccharide deacetylase family protein [Treponema sp.]